MLDTVADKNFGLLLFRKAPAKADKLEACGEGSLLRVAGREESQGREEPYLVDGAVPFENPKWIYRFKNMFKRKSGSGISLEFDTKFGRFFFGIVNVLPAAR